MTDNNECVSKAPKRLTAQMWDKMQFLFRNYYDRMIHVYLKFDTHLDYNALRKAYKYLVDGIPVLHSSFVNNPIRPYWKVTQHYTADDILSFKSSDDPESDADEFITQCLPAKGNVQIKAMLIRGVNGDILVQIVNHMCMDGADFKEFTALLSRIYSAVVAGENIDVEIKNGDRSHYQVYSKMDEKQKKTALGLYKNVSMVKHQIRFPYTRRDKKNDKSRILRRVMSEKDLAAIKAVGEKYGATVNDILLVAYMRSLYKACGIPASDNVSVPCMVDLRRHIAGGKSLGFSNHVGFMIGTAHGLKDYAAMLDDIHTQSEEAKNDPYMGLYSLPLLNLAYTLFPQCIAEIAIGIGYTNPYTGMSNLGLLPESSLTFGSHTPSDAYITGAIKSKPYLQLAVCTYKQKLNLTIAVKCNSEDVKKLEVFIDDIVNEIYSMTK